MRLLTNKSRREAAMSNIFCGISPIVCFLGSFFLFGGNVHAGTRLSGTYLATAYSQTGVTASGLYTHRHVVAADPDILPIGSRIRIERAGKYSGEYVVADTGGKIQGRRLDIYMPNTAECKKFGVKHVRVEVVELGKKTHASAKESNLKVAADVRSTLKQGSVGGAATEVDWAQKGATMNQIAAEESAPDNSVEAENRPPARNSRRQR